MDRHGNKVWPHRPDPNPPTILKVPADSVPFGESISNNGRTVWAAYEGDELIAVAPTSAEVRAKFSEVRRKRK
jgi:hypothetical protein